MKPFDDVSKLSIATIRSLVIDMTNKAKSGHPGMAIGSAPILYTLFTRFLVAVPNDDKWINRDRFVLSAGHASALLYAVLHIAGYHISMDDLKNFRQLHSITPGHPEVTLTPGVDATTGPLGQGLAQAVGMAVAEERLRSAGKFQGFGHYTYCLVGDGCLQEGISQEAISFAGHQQLNKLIVFYDSNDVTLDGPLSNSFDENVSIRFKASGWNVLYVEDGNDVEDIAAAIVKAHKSTSKPTLIIVKTTIGQGSINEGTSRVHGNPLGEEDGLRAKKSYGFNYPPFTVPDEVYQDFRDTFYSRGKQAMYEFNQVLATMKEENPTDYRFCINAVHQYNLKEINYDFMQFSNNLVESTRKTSGKILNEINKQIPYMMGGSADVAGSVMTKLDKEFGDFTPRNRRGRNINFGIREFAMAAIQNGILLHGGLKTYVGTFLVFSDYMKNAIRLAALSNLPAIYLFSHDSVALGEDGPTHQPIEQLAMLRSIPRLSVWRPADARETLVAWKTAMESHKTPHAIVLTRQNVPLLPGSSDLNLVSKGGYVVSKEQDGNLDTTLLATGSEVSLAIDIQKDLYTHGVNARVVSIPSIEQFLSQDDEYINDVYGVSYDKRFSLEMLSTFGWHKLAAHPLGIDDFGLSAPMNDVIKALKFTKEDLTKKILATLNR
jgi:transketolase